MPNNFNNFRQNNHFERSSLLRICIIKLRFGVNRTPSKKFSDSNSPRLRDVTVMVPVSLGVIVSNSSNLGLLQWLYSFPQESQSRLYQINNASNSASHIVLALGYGFYDSNIRRLNRLIIGLMLSRMKAERDGKEGVVANINKTCKTCTTVLIGSQESHRWFMPAPANHRLSAEHYWLSDLIEFELLTNNTSVETD